MNDLGRAHYLFYSRACFLFGRERNACCLCRQLIDLVTIQNKLGILVINASSKIKLRNVGNMLAESSEHASEKRRKSMVLRLIDRCGTSICVRVEVAHSIILSKIKIRGHESICLIMINTRPFSSALSAEAKSSTCLFALIFVRGESCEVGTLLHSI